MKLITFLITIISVVIVVVVDKQLVSLIIPIFLVLFIINWIAISLFYRWYEKKLFSKRNCSCGSFDKYPLFIKLKIWESTLNLHPRYVALYNNFLQTCINFKLQCEHCRHVKRIKFLGEIYYFVKNKNERDKVLDQLKVAYDEKENLREEALKNAVSQFRVIKDINDNQKL